jgi:hypothetical protein
MILICNTLKYLYLRYFKKLCKNTLKLQNNDKIKALNKNK